MLAAPVFTITEEPETEEEVDKEESPGCTKAPDPLVVEPFVILDSSMQVPTNLEETEAEQLIDVEPNVSFTPTERVAPEQDKDADAVLVFIPDADKETELLKEDLAAICNS
tara:strand:+ start:649 stop:981 length:333 start_codon:yes stop_codon:yes gene_type:complete